MRLRGTTLIEVIAAALIIGLSVVGGISAIRFVSNRMTSSQGVLSAGLIGKAEIEHAKIFGYAGLPYGTVQLDSNGNVSGAGTWSGSFDATSNAGTGGWVSDQTTYYDWNGNQLSSSSGAIFGVLTSISDTGTNQVLPTTAGKSVAVSYTLDNYAQRLVTVKVSWAQSGTPILSQCTVIVKGGI